MSDRAVESGLELVLDNKRLIIGFLVLISFCGGFFILGFEEGKRQGSRGETQKAVAVVSPNSEAPPSASPAANDSEMKKSAEQVVPAEQSLDWYKSVNRQEGESLIESPEPSEDKPKTKVPPPVPTSYTVQVGAFRQKREVEAKAQLLKSKGFNYRIESPQSSEQLYLLKVGKFSSRADAVAMQIRLRKNGFACFIKTNELP